MLKMKNKLSAYLQTQPKISHHNLPKYAFSPAKGKKGREGGREEGRKEGKKKLNIIYTINVAQKNVILNFSMSNMKQQQQKRPSKTNYKVRQFIYLHTQKICLTYEILTLDNKCSAQIMSSVPRKCPDAHLPQLCSWKLCLLSVTSLIKP